MFGLDAYVASMMLLRLGSALMELTGASLMAYFNRIDAAVRINALMGLIGPLILISATTVGVVGMAGELSWSRILFVFVGVGLILYGVH